MSARRSHEPARPPDEPIERKAAYLELAEAASGHRRRLTAAELEELRTSGPSGPAMLADALKALARARSQAGGGPVMRAALHRVAVAAVSWADRL